jgi:hypothetical protein
MKLSPHLLREATALLGSEQLDLLTTTHPLHSIVFGRARRTLGIATPMVYAVPDYGVPASGYYPAYPALRPDGLIVLEESTLDHYRGLGVPDDRLHLSGFLTREPFVQVGARLRAEGREGARLALRAEVARAHPAFSASAFALDRPTLIFLGGSAWGEDRPCWRMLADAGSGGRPTWWWWPAVARTRGRTLLGRRWAPLRFAPRGPWR